MGITSNESPFLKMVFARPLVDWIFFKVLGSAESNLPSCVVQNVHVLMHRVCASQKELSFGRKHFMLVYRMDFPRFSASLWSVGWISQLKRVLFGPLTGAIGPSLPPSSFCKLQRLSSARFRYSTGSYAYRSVFCCWFFFSFDHHFRY